MGTFPINFRTRIPSRFHSPFSWIETGTEKGESVKQVLLYGGFSTLDSIEVNVSLYTKAHALFSPFKEVTIHCGESPRVLEHLFSNSFRRNVPTVFWIDAHFSGGSREEMSQKGWGECPLLAELDSIFTHSWSVPPVLIIDDAEMFQKDFWNTRQEARWFNWRDWPSLEQIKTRMPGYVIQIVKEELNEVVYAWKE